MSERFEPCCAGCRYFRVADAITGICHRYPPVYAGNSSPRESHHWRHPVVGPHAWCGEWRSAADDQISSIGATS